MSSYLQKRKEKKKNDTFTDDLHTKEQTANIDLSKSVIQDLKLLNFHAHKQLFALSN